MAATEIKAGTGLTALDFNTIGAMPAVQALDAADGGFLDCSGIQDQKLLIIVENADAVNSEDFTIKKGNGLQGVADKVSSLVKSTTSVIVVESGAYKQVSGTNKDKILFTGSADVKVAAVVLP